jgi:hypothetical protein
VAGQESSRFRITVWPPELPGPDNIAVPRLHGYRCGDDGEGRFAGDGTRLPPAPLGDLIQYPEGVGGAGFALRLSENEMTSYLLDQFSSYFMLTDEERLRAVAAPEDLFLRELLAIRPVEPGSVVDFVRSYGPLTLASDVYRVRPGARFQPGHGVLGERLGTELDLALAHDAAGSHRYGVLEHMRAASVDDSIELVRQGGVGSDREKTSASWTGYTLRGQLAMISVFQAVVENWVTIMDDAWGGAIDALDVLVPVQLQAPWVSRGLPTPESIIELLDTLTELVTAVAGSVRPHIEVAHPELERLKTAHGRPIPDVTTVLCLQLMRFVARGAPAQRCVNETCGRLFTRHRGRSQYGQTKSTAIMYCSSNCARAQAQREYRRRQKPSSTENETDAQI